MAYRLLTRTADGSVLLEEMEKRQIAKSKVSSLLFISFFLKKAGAL
jgi:hypothetical protein